MKNAGSFHINHHFPVVFPWFSHGFPTFSSPHSSPLRQSEATNGHWTMPGDPRISPRSTTYAAPRSPKRIWQFGPKKLNKYIIYIYMYNIYILEISIGTFYLSICLSVYLPNYLSIFLSNLI
jgi:hypothetical protein